MGTKDRSALRGVQGVTHPPLPPEELKRISALQKSHDAILLLREIERLRAVELRALQLANMVAEQPGWMAGDLVDGLRATIEGALTSPGHFGVKGATVNIKPGRKTRATVGLPGTGLSETVNLESDTERAPRAGPSGTFVVIVIVIMLVLFGVYGVMH